MLLRVRSELNIYVRYGPKHEPLAYEVLYTTCVHNRISREFAVVMCCPKPVLRFLKYLLAIILQANSLQQQENRFSFEQIKFT
jgi:hypothetical protein